jgi:hypothetical protein
METRLAREVGIGCAVTLDIRDYFVRFAHDQKANFSEGNISRLAMGVRF